MQTIYKLFSFKVDNIRKIFKNQHIQSSEEAYIGATLTNYTFLETSFHVARRMLLSWTIEQL